MASSSRQDPQRGRSRSRSRSLDRPQEHHRKSGERRTVDKDDRHFAHHSHARRSASPRRHRSRSGSRSPRRRHSDSKSRSRSRERGSHRHRDRDRDRERPKRGRSRSRSLSNGSSASSDYKRKKRRKEKKRERTSRSRERKERKREKKEKKKKKSAATTAQWGKYGIISDSDLYNKEQEFRTWLVEERKINPETISKDQTKKEFARFTEDFNTATLPHEKYYHMEAYEARMSALRQGEFVPPPDDAYDPNADMRALQSKHKRQVIEQESYLNKEQLQELRKVQFERIEAGKMKLMGMDVKHNMGVRMDGTMFDG